MDDNSDSLTPPAGAPDPLFNVDAARKLRARRRKLFRWGLVLVVLATVGLGVLMVAANQVIISASAGKTYDTMDNLPAHRVGLLLGTGKYLNNGDINLYYQYRIEAAVELYKQGLIKEILVSGDNSRADYDEPSEMEGDLIAQGIPAGDIHLDYAGFSTLDSIIRAQKIFGQSDLTVISQEFHNQRAIYIANQKGMEVVGYNAKNVSAQYGWKVQLRERLARVKALLDITFGRRPKYLGEMITID